MMRLLIGIIAGYVGSDLLSANVPWASQFKVQPKSQLLRTGITSAPQAVTQGKMSYPEYMKKLMALELLED